MAENRIHWQGVIPAITTPFKPDLTVDHDFLKSHVRTLIEQGCTGIVPGGSLGEGATLTLEEKVAVTRACLEAVQSKAPVIPGVAALSTAEAVRQAEALTEAGCQGLMVLPPYQYSTDWREMKAHVAAVFQATPLPCMLYNNPIAYKTDFLPEQIAELADEFDNLQAVKESSADIRRLMSLRARIGDRLSLLVGVDDLIVEGIAAGAEGWIAGLANAFPRESVALFDLARKGGHERAFELYRWFLPLLRLDTVPKFVQLIKLAQNAVELGNTRVRPPRLELTGVELEEATGTIERAIATRPAF